MPVFVCELATNKQKLAGRRKIENVIETECQDGLFFSWSSTQNKLQSIHTQFIFYSVCDYQRHSECNLKKGNMCPRDIPICTFNPPQSWPIDQKVVKTQCVLLCKRNFRVMKQVSISCIPVSLILDIHCTHVHAIRSCIQDRVLK